MVKYLVIILLLLCACQKEPEYCFECHADQDGLPISETFCGYTEQEMNQVIDYWKTSCIDSIELKCVKK